MSCLILYTVRLLVNRLAGALPVPPRPPAAPAAAAAAGAAAGAAAPAPAAGEKAAGAVGKSRSEEAEGEGIKYEGYAEAIAAAQASAGCRTGLCRMPALPRRACMRVHGCCIPYTISLRNRQHADGVAMQPPHLDRAGRPAPAGPAHQPDRARRRSRRPRLARRSWWGRQGVPHEEPDQISHELVHWRFRTHQPQQEELGCRPNRGNHRRRRRWRCGRGSGGSGSGGGGSGGGGRCSCLRACGWATGRGAGGGPASSGASSGAGRRGRGQQERTWLAAHAGCHAQPV